MPFEPDTALPADDTALPADETAAPADPDAAWRDRLVELHVLAEHGDEAAAGEAKAWIDSDERARHAWHQIQSTCDQLRGA